MGKKSLKPRPSLPRKKRSVKIRKRNGGGVKNSVEEAVETSKFYVKTSKSYFNKSKSYVNKFVKDYKPKIKVKLKELKKLDRIDVWNVITNKKLKLKDVGLIFLFGTGLSWFVGSNLIYLALSYFIALMNPAIFESIGAPPVKPFEYNTKTVAYWEKEEKKQDYLKKWAKYYVYCINHIQYYTKPKNIPDDVWQTYTISRMEKESLTDITDKKRSEYQIEKQKRLYEDAERNLSQLYGKESWEYELNNAMELYKRELELEFQKSSENQYAKARQKMISKRREEMRHDITDEILKKTGRKGLYNSEFNIYRHIIREKSAKPLFFIGETLINNENIRFNLQEVCEGKKILLYFSSWLCPSCQRFTPLLKRHSQKLTDKNIVVIFIPLRDSYSSLLKKSTEKKFKEYFNKMPNNWYCIEGPCDSINAKGLNKTDTRLIKLFKIPGIPNFTYIDGTTGEAIPNHWEYEKDDGPWAPMLKRVDFKLKEAYPTKAECTYKVGRREFTVDWTHNPPVQTAEWQNGRQSNRIRNPFNDAGCVSMEDVAAAVEEARSVRNQAKLDADSNATAVAEAKRAVSEERAEAKRAEAAEAKRAEAEIKETEAKNVPRRSSTRRRPPPKRYGL
jgi:thiol-disulfide isomerase/thioredoxin